MRANSQVRSGGAAVDQGVDSPPLEKGAKQTLVRVCSAKAAADTASSTDKTRCFSRRGRVRWGGDERARRPALVRLSPPWGGTTGLDAHLDRGGIEGTLSRRYFSRGKSE